MADISKEPMTTLYQIFDRVAGAVTGPIIAFRSLAPAVREFHAVLANANTMPGQHPGDFDLLRVGEQYEDGEVVGGLPQVVATGASWAAAQVARAEVVK